MKINGKKRMIKRINYERLFERWLIKILNYYLNMQKPIPIVKKQNLQKMKNIYKSYLKLWVVQEKI